uniref:Serine protease n=1 Tax=Leptobrachium leishanense TaxID=445787 RepID=A0A8C5MEW2_9ANUR
MPGDLPKIKAEDSESVTLTFRWKNKSDENKFIISGNKCDLLIDVLKTSDNFKEKFNDSLYLLVQSSKLNAAVSPYIPIRALSAGEHLEISQRRLQLPKIPNYTQESDGKLIRLNKQGTTKGGKERKILLKKQYCPGDLKLGVFGYEEQTIHDAISADGRFDISPDTKFILRGKEEEQYESHLHLAFLKDDIYTVVLLPTKRSASKGKGHATNNRIPESQHAHNVPSTSQSDPTSNTGGLEEESHSPSSSLSGPASNTGGLEEESHSPSSSLSVRNSTESVVFYPIQLPQYKKLYEKFTKNFAETYGSESSTAFNALRNNHYYIKDKHITLASTLEILAKHVKSVGMITIQHGQKPYTGTCFLLTDSIVLTCYHVVEPVLPRKLSRENQAVYFSKARHRQNQRNRSNYNKVLAHRRPIRKAVRTLTSNARRARLHAAWCKFISEFQRTLRREAYITFNYERDGSAMETSYQVSKILHLSKVHDFIFLQLDGPVPDTQGLLHYLAFPPEEGVVTIIGHPEGRVKQSDFICPVIKFEERESEIRKHSLFIHLTTRFSFNEIKGKDTLTYDTCFYQGSSGSPVFNDQGKLVAMHSGGYIPEPLKIKKSIIEFGRSFPEMIIRGAVKIKRLRAALKECVKRDLELKKEISEIYKHRLELQPVIRRLQQLWKAEREPNTQSSLESNPFSDPEETPMETQSQ